MLLLVVNIWSSCRASPSPDELYPSNGVTTLIRINFFRFEPLDNALLSLELQERKGQSHESGALAVA
jgi:hypothetical protein